MKLRIDDNGWKQQGALLKKSISERIPVEYTEEGLSIVLHVDSSIGPDESYKITEENGGFSIIGSDEMGLFYGIGKFLHTARWNENEFVPSPPSGVVTPACSFRASYFAVHCYNWYQMAPQEELEAYLEDMLLWGYNAIVCIVPILNIDSFDDELFFESVKKTRAIYQLAKQVGMKIGIIICPNQGHRNVPKEFEADYSYDPTGKIRPHGGNNICPSKHGAVEYLKTIWHALLGAYQDIGLDYVISWSYDEGGCGCDECRPWGAKAYCDLVNELYKESMKVYPNAKFIVSTWLFDAICDEGEYEGLYHRLTEDMSYADYLMIDAPGSFPNYPLEHKVIKPIVNFPEISMWGLYPWGGRGANPLLKRFQDNWNRAKGVLQGGMPYSEGLYEDISKIQFIGYYWEPNKHYRDILKEYISYYYSEEVFADAIEMMELIEENHITVARGDKPNREVGVRSAQLAVSIEKRLGEQARQSWRWRVLYIRAKLDDILYRTFLDNHMEGEQVLQDLKRTREYLIDDNNEAQELLQELCRYYHSVDKTPENRYTFPPVKNGKVRKI